MPNHDLVAHAQAVLDANSYLTLATADPEGRPWSSPVYFAAAGRWEFYWVSAAAAQHSRNLSGRPQVSLVVFDSTVEPYHGRAVYAIGAACEVTGDDLTRGLESYPGPTQRGVAPITVEDVTGSSPYRLYRVIASELWVLCPREPKQPCPLHGLAEDHRTRVQ